jgi:hypothetical protein
MSADLQIDYAACAPKHGNIRDNQENDSNELALQAMQRRQRARR